MCWAGCADPPPYFGTLRLVLIWNSKVRLHSCGLYRTLQPSCE